MSELHCQMFSYFCNVWISEIYFLLEIICMSEHYVACSFDWTLQIFCKWYKYKNTTFSEAEVSAVVTRSCQNTSPFARNRNGLGDTFGSLVSLTKIQLYTLVPPKECVNIAMHTGAIFIENDAQELCPTEKFAVFFCFCIFNKEWLTKSCISVSFLNLVKIY